MVYELATPTLSQVGAYPLSDSCGKLKMVGDPSLPQWYTLTNDDPNPGEATLSVETVNPDHVGIHQA